MQEEANQKTVGIAVQVTKMTGRAFLRACEKYLQYRKDKRTSPPTYIIFFKGKNAEVNCNGLW